MIELPQTIRIARIDEIPEDSFALERLQLVESAKIVEGFTLKIKDNNDEALSNIPFNFYSEINIDNSKLWNLINSLAELLPNTISLIVCYSEDEPNYYDYIEKTQLLNQIEPYKTELTQDAFLEWGIIYSDKESLTEIFVRDSKYVRFWGMDINGFKTIMRKFNLNQIDDLEFIDEYPKVREPLSLHDNTCIETEDLIERLEKITVGNIV